MTKLKPRYNFGSTPCKSCRVLAQIGDVDVLVCDDMQEDGPMLLVHYLSKRHEHPTEHTIYDGEQSIRYFRENMLGEMPEDTIDAIVTMLRLMPSNC